MTTYFPITLFLLCTLYGYLDTKHTDNVTEVRVTLLTDEKVKDNENPIYSTQLEKETKDARRRGPIRTSISVENVSNSRAPEISSERRNAYNSIRDRRAYFKRREEAARQRKPQSRRVDPDKDVLEPQETVHRPQVHNIPKHSVINVDKKFYEFGLKLPKRISTKLSRVDGWGTTALPGDMDMENFVMPLESKFSPKMSRLENEPTTLPPLVVHPLPLSVPERKYPTTIEINENNKRVLSEMNREMLLTTTASPFKGESIGQRSVVSTPLNIVDHINGVSSERPVTRATEQTQPFTATASTPVSEIQSESSMTKKPNNANALESRAINSPELENIPFLRNGEIPTTDASVNTSKVGVVDKVPEITFTERTTPKLQSTPMDDTDPQKVVTTPTLVEVPTPTSPTEINVENKPKSDDSDEVKSFVPVNNTSNTITVTNITLDDSTADTIPVSPISSPPGPGSYISKSENKTTDFPNDVGISENVNLNSETSDAANQENALIDFDRATSTTASPTYIKVYVTDQPTEDSSLTIFYAEPGPESNMSDPGIVVSIVDEASAVHSVGLAVYLLAVFGLVPLVLAFAFGARYYLNRHGRKSECDSDVSSTDVTVARTRGSELRKSPSSATTITLVHATRLPRVQQKCPSWELSRQQLTLLSILGHGNFGQVWKAELKETGSSNTRLVAVKTVKEGATEKEQEELIKELHVMQQAGHHPNVVTLLGCCTEKDPYFLVMEYISNGKLLTYLREHRTQENYYNFSNDSEALTSRDLTVFMYCVARGMEYLASKRIIHRDLAARNVLVDQHKMCKIADFGMSRLVQEGGAGEVYEERQNRGALPIRWMAPESLLYSVFTHKSDVWSFGILMWEIVTLGSTPYPSLGAREVVQGVRDGMRLQRPSHVKSDLFRLISHCWADDPQSRPSFTELRLHLADQLDGSCVDLDSFALDNRFQLQTRTKTRRSRNTGKGTVTLVGNGSFTVNSRILDNQFSIV